LICEVYFTNKKNLKPEGNPLESRTLPKVHKKPQNIHIVLRKRFILRESKVGKEELKNVFHNKK